MAFVYSGFGRRRPVSPRRRRSPILCPADIAQAFEHEAQRRRAVGERKSAVRLDVRASYFRGFTR